MKHITLLAGLVISMGASAQINDGNFETSLTDTTIWHQHSTNFGTPLCTTAACAPGSTVFIPFQGTVYAWFGGAGSAGLPEIGSLSQTTIIPTGTNTTLAMWVKIPTGGVAADYFKVYVDGVEVASLTAADTVGYDSYTGWGVDVSAYADGASHEIAMVGNQTASGTSSFNVLVDDVSLQADGSTIGIFENESLPGIQVYPNPASEQLTLSFNAMHGQALITIADMAGKVVRSQNIGEVNMTTMDFDARALNNGAYLVTVQQDGVSYQQRVVVAH